jgi:hypothetical protein
MGKNEKCICNLISVSCWLQQLLIYNPSVECRLSVWNGRRRLTEQKRTTKQEASKHFVPSHV